ncbi:MAG: polysaccharide deacetylase family protein [Chitinophagales bacterium]
MYLVKTPHYLKRLYPSLIWDLQKDQGIYLTFDDGPVPDVTEKVLDILRYYAVQATFFCIGKNVAAHPDIFERIKTEGHAIGNHTQNHLNGWKTENVSYFRDVLTCADQVNSTLFRPPYGRIGYHQIQYLRKKFRIVMWDVLSGDFDTHIHADTCTEHVLQNTVEGSIIVYHDSEKAKARVLPSIEKVIPELLAKGFIFKTIPQE